ncbi:MAG: hypothetical protein ABI599_03675 [Flavobacteriales bacterium]
MWAPKRFNDEEGSVFRWTIVLLWIGITFKLTHLACTSPILDLIGTIGLGFGAGSTASVVTSHIVRTIKEHKLREHFESYAGAWKREILYQYSYLSIDHKTGAVKRVSKHRIKEAYDRSITIEYKGGRTLHLLVDYDPTGRGTVAGQVEFNADKGIVGEGTYLYVNGPLKAPADNDGVPHSGKYTLHWFPSDNRDTIHVYYDGLMPEPDAKGYEVWRKDPTGPHHHSWNEST